MKCELCEVGEVYDFHHFIPRTLHSNKWFKKRYVKSQLNEGLRICKECHKTLHDLIPSEKEMGKKYNSKDRLLSHPSVAKYIAWRKARSKS